MAPDDAVLAAADAEFSDWMRGNLVRAAGHFGLTVTGEPTFGWRLRTIGAQATGPDGPRWLRVVTEFPQYAHGETWTGTADANVVAGLPKPTVLDVHEWEEDGWRRQRAEAQTLLSGEPVSTTCHLTEVPVGLDERWWEQLRRAVDALRPTPTYRRHTDPVALSQRAAEVFGQRLPVSQWETVHGDLHWGNLLSHGFALLDWELWGRGPAGYDAATLLLHSLLVPEIADRVHQAFADQLDSDSGRTAQLAAAVRMHSRISRGDYRELVGPLRDHVRGLGASITSI